MSIQGVAGASCFLRRPIYRPSKQTIRHQRGGIHREAERCGEGISCKPYPAESPSPVSKHQFKSSLLGICVRGISTIVQSCFAYISPTKVYFQGHARPQRTRAGRVPADSGRSPLHSIASIDRCLSSDRGPHAQGAGRRRWRGALHRGKRAPTENVQPPRFPSAASCHRVMTCLEKLSMAWISVLDK